MKMEMADDNDEKVKIFSVHRRRKWDFNCPSMTCQLLVSQEKSRNGQQQSMITLEFSFCIRIGKPSKVFSKEYKWYGVAFI